MLFRLLHADDHADVVLDVGTDAVLVRAGLDQVKAERLAELLNSLVGAADPCRARAVCGNDGQIIRFEG